ncbi:hypothetical protein [Massilia niastensis]|uniref:hypothetical protein n=1 Tax=Massilia niastensis TaxID=544911 RepID=UPI000378A837|nr:hypothetical protein [Massilia niastensis]
MGSTKQPCKHSIRAWMLQRQRQPAPLPDIAEIRRAVGWGAARPAPEAIVRRDDAVPRTLSDH